MPRSPTGTADFSCVCEEMYPDALYITLLQRFSVSLICNHLCYLAPESFISWALHTCLQMLLGAANVAVQTGNGSIYVLVLSECRPIVNLFTCVELLEHRDQGWLFKVDIEKMKKRISVPVGSCQLSAPLDGEGTPTSQLLSALFNSYSDILSDLLNCMTGRQCCCVFIYWKKSCDSLHITVVVTFQ